MNGHQKSGSRRPATLLALVLAIILALAAFYAPKYLAYADRPIKSDAVVLFIGPGFNAREMEAWRLIKDGYAQYLLIPALGSVGKNSSTILGQVNFRRDLVKFYRPDMEGSPEGREMPFQNGNLPVQNTHLEVLEAKRMMSEHGLKSALFVSSPWHMRRIKIIAESVFNGDEKYVITCVPTSFEKLPKSLSDCCKYAYQSIILEYLKISSFLAYSYFGFGHF